MTTVYGLSGDLQHAAIFANPEAAFPLELMALMDMPTFVRGRSALTLGIWKRFRLAQSFSSAGKKGGIESVSSLPRCLLDIFSTIQDESFETSFLAWPGYVGEVPEIHLWEAYRLAGILTGRRLRKIRTDNGSNEAIPVPAMASTDLLLGRLVAAVDALCDTRSRPEYAQFLTTNSLLYPYVAARLEVATLLRHPTWMATLCRVANICQPYGITANAQNITNMLDEAWNTQDDNYDIDQQAQRRNVEIALF
ncbi:C6 finger domain-containing protein [Colletotrichum tofieldiae]|nr:C6 finger domain-containing protein [Colletotrichum tofieldiae]GKT91286.1 C6 finger domain-containing protein [Colletotrichum tofieldiae]